MKLFVLVAALLATLSAAQSSPSLDKFSAVRVNGVARALLSEQHACVEASSCGDHDWRVVGKAALAVPHKISVAVRRRNVAALERTLHERADHRSPLYTQWLSHDEVRALIGNDEAREAVLAWLDAHGLRTHVKADYVEAFGTIEQMQTLLRVPFYKYESAAMPGKVVHRAAFASVPAELAAHVDMIVGVDQFPATLRPAPMIQSVDQAKMRAAMAQGGRATAQGQTTPQLLFDYYYIRSTGIVNGGNQSVMEALGQNYNQQDLNLFMNQFSLPQQTMRYQVGPNDPDACYTNGNSCGEANLDVQYLMAIATNGPTTYWSIASDVSDIFYEWISEMMSVSTPPLVNSLSYGGIEEYMPSSHLDRFNQDAMTLASQGVTIVVSSGDDGVANFIARADRSKCGFHPSFPASSPYALAVGATQGPEFSQPEIACASDTNGLITTGGGFSSYFSRPSWQQSAVEGFLSKSPTPTSMFSSQNRAYPDVSMLGHNYVVVVGGQFVIVSGTSASAPVMAAVIALVNDDRASSGLGPLGWINQRLYDSSSSSIFWDVTSGKNNCCAGSASSAICCEYGFTCVEGFDAVTGLGTVDFRAFSKVFGPSK